MIQAHRRPQQPAGVDAARLTAGSALWLSGFFGLAGGFLDLFAKVMEADYVNRTMFYLEGPHYPWVIPLANLLVLLVPGILVAAATALRPRLVSVRAAAWLYATLALWGALLRMPLFGIAALILAMGLARWISLIVAGVSVRRPRLLRGTVVGLACVLIALGSFSIGRQALAESRAASRLPAASPGARNVLLLVMDTVRAESLSLYGYHRPTTPQLARWARKGVRFDWALAPAPWTFPSHATFFTGQWPYKLISYSPEWRGRLDTAYPTLAEYLASRGYLTAGFVANTTWCSYETGLNRGFAHYEDYVLSPRVILSSAKLGRWVVAQSLGAQNIFDFKWIIKFQSRDAQGINRGFLDWLGRKPQGRPFFAFLNYLDAHSPYAVPEGDTQHFGLQPRTPADHQVLLQYADIDKRNIGPAELALPHDAYDDCIAYLDRQIGSLLDELERRGVLQNTLVLVTADHGELFGEHDLYGHGTSLYLPEIHVPLLVIAPGLVPASQVVSEPVSLRDLAATVVDLAGQAAGAPFPGGSLAACWGSDAKEGRPPISAAVSEHSNKPVLEPGKGRGPTQRGFAMSQVGGALHYILDSAGNEELFGLKHDRAETSNLKGSTGERAALGEYRNSLLHVLNTGPASHRDEEPYLQSYKRQLEFLVKGGSSTPLLDLPTDSQASP